MTAYSPLSLFFALHECSSVDEGLRRHFEELSMMISLMFGDNNGNALRNVELGLGLDWRGEVLTVIFVVKHK